MRGPKVGARLWDTCVRKQEWPARVCVRTFGVGPEGSRYVALLPAWVHTRSCLSQRVDGNEAFGFST